MKATKLFLSLLLLSLSFVACGAPPTTKDQRTNTAPETSFTCFTGTPATSAQFLDACTLDAVAKVEKVSVIPRREDQALPPVQ